MREWCIAAVLLAAACDHAGGRPEGPQVGPGIVTSDGGGVDTGEESRLDLGTVPEPDLPAAETSTGKVASTGPVDTSSTTSTGEASTSTGEVDASSSTGGSSSTGDPPAPVCGDGICDPAERAPCWDWVDGHWGPSFCPDCMSDPACVAVLDCPCTPEAAAVKSWCFAEPLPACGATAPEGACSVSTALAFYQWNAKCG